MSAREGAAPPMKKRQRPLRLQIFVLTLEEKKAVACVLAAFILGLATKHYRAMHPSPPPPPTAREQYATQRAAKVAAARARSARGQATAAQLRPPPSPDGDEED